MGYYVRFQISWGGRSAPEATAQIAQKFLNKHKKFLLEWKNDEERQKAYAASFFSEVASKKAYFGGTKGDFWCWGKINNALNAGKLLDLLLPFFKELYSEGIISSFERVLAFCEQEQKKNVMVYDLRWNRKNNAIKINVFNSKGKWYWGQM